MSAVNARSLCHAAWAFRNREKRLEPKYPALKTLHRIMMRKPLSEALFFHAVLWIIPPTVTRSILISHHIDLASGSGLSGFFEGLISGFFQDLFIALAVYVILGFINFLMAKRPLTSKRILFLLSFLCFSFYSVYLLIDLFLTLNLGVRINNVLFYFLSDIRPFIDSAKNLGFFLFLALVLLIAGLSLILFKIYFKKFQMQKLSIASIGSAIGTLVIAVLLNGVPPYNVKYYSASPVFAVNFDLMARFVGHDHSGPDQMSQNDILSTLSCHDTEEFSLISPEFPLLKMTKGYKGQKCFHIKVKKDERPHLIFLFLESFSAKDVGALGSKMGATPVFDMLEKEGVLFTNFYSTGVQTTRSVISSLFGIMPRYTKKAVQSDDPELPLIGIADLLNMRGYLSAYFHNGSLDFEGKTDFFSKHGYSEIYGREDILEKFPHAEKTSWGIHDEYLMQFVTDWMSQKDKEKQPVFLTMFTVSIHHPYLVPSHFNPPPFNITDDFASRPFSREKAKRIYARYLKTVHYTDYCIGLFIRFLKARGLYDKSIIFILADNSAPMGEHRENFFSIRYLYEENLKIPLLILAPGRLKKPVVVDEVGSQMDLLPTVMDILGISGLNHAMGTSLVREAQGKTIFFNNPFELGYRGLRKGSMKFIYSKQEKGIIGELYDLESDPAEKENLLTDLDSVRGYFEEAEKIHRVSGSLYRNRNFAPSD
jgi:phosphoglycerol transferase MdoB-like AlkP superfamily enzyme